MKWMPWMIVFTAAVTVAGTAHAGDRPNSLDAGKSALQFSVSGRNFFSLNTFNGGVAFKHQKSDRSAWRFAVDLGGFASKGEQAPNAYDDKRVDVRGTVLFQRYVNPDAEANFYWGVGPTGGYTRETQSTDSTSTKDTRWNVGIQAAAGIEWFATQAISLHAEYTAYAMYGAEKGTPAYSPQKVDTHAWTLQTDGVLFGMSVYF